MKFAIIFANTTIHSHVVVMNITFTYFRNIRNQIKVLTSTKPDTFANASCNFSHSILFYDEKIGSNFSMLEFDFEFHF